MTENNILVTGAAGFIGAALVKRFLDDGSRVIGIDDLNNYYDVSLKKKRLDLISEKKRKTNGEWFFYERSIENFDDLDSIAKNFKINIVINLAAQAGVRYSLQNPKKYIDSNLVGFGNVLELCRKYQIENFIYASSSSVYGGNMNYPFRETSLVEHPVSLYAATKKANEAMAHSYSHLFNIPSTGLRFFTVYGPWGRPDMALFLFTKAMLEGKPINLFNNGNMIRDFTYVEDIIESMFRLISYPAKGNKEFNYIQPDPSESWAPHKIFNIGNSDPIPLLDYVEALEDSLGIKAIKNYMPMQDGDVALTSSDCSRLETWIKFRPKTSIKEGINQFVSWYKNYYGF